MSSTRNNYSPTNVVLRDWLAGMAMQAFLSDFKTFCRFIKGDSHEAIANSSYEMAHAMLAERSKKRKE